MAVFDVGPLPSGRDVRGGEGVQEKLAKSDHGGLDDPVLFKQKTNALAKLLRHAMSRFSRETLYHALQLAVNSDVWSESEAGKMASISQLRSLLAAWARVDKETGLSTATKQAANCLRLFVKDVEHFREVKELFDEGLYNFLFYEYYDPTPPSDKNPLGSSHLRDRYDDVDSGHFSGTELDEVAMDSFRSGESRDPRLGISTMEHMGGNERHKLEVTVRELREVSERWDGLLQESTLDVANFDPDSYHELVDFSNYANFEPIFRLLPDVFAKCYKCVELAKQWWNLSHAVYPALPLGRPRPLPTSSSPDTDILLSAEEDEEEKEEGEEEREEDEEEREEDEEDREEGDEEARQAASDEGEEESMASDQEGDHVTREEAHRHVKDLQARVEGLGRNLQELEEQLAAKTEELRTLSLREQRYEELVDALEAAEDRLSHLQTRQQLSLQERESVAERFSFALRGTTEYFRCEAELERLADEMRSGERETALVRYQHTLLCQDYELQLTVRPSLILVAENVRTDIMTISDLLEAQREEKTRLEKELALAKTNTEQIRDFVRSKVPTTDSLKRASDRSPKKTSRARKPEVPAISLSHVHPPSGDPSVVTSDSLFGDRYEEVVLGSHPPLDTTISPSPRSVSSRYTDELSEGEKPEVDAKGKGGTAKRSRKPEAAGKSKRAGESDPSVRSTASHRTEANPELENFETGEADRDHRLSVPVSQSNPDKRRARKQTVLAGVTEREEQKGKVARNQDLRSLEASNEWDGKAVAPTSVSAIRRIARDKNREGDAGASQADGHRARQRESHRGSTSEPVSEKDADGSVDVKPQRRDVKKKRTVADRHLDQNKPELQDPSGAGTKRTVSVEQDQAGRGVRSDSSRSRLPRPVQLNRPRQQSTSEEAPLAEKDAGTTLPHSSQPSGRSRRILPEIRLSGSTEKRASVDQKRVGKDLGDGRVELGTRERAYSERSSRGVDMMIPNPPPSKARGGVRDHPGQREGEDGRGDENALKDTKRSHPRKRFVTERLEATDFVPDRRATMAQDAVPPVSTKQELDPHSRQRSNSERAQPRTAANSAPRDSSVLAPQPRMRSNSDRMAGRKHVKQDLSTRVK